MATNPTNIDRLRIATPCPISWEQMTGDNRVRHCDHCHLNVYNISELSLIEAEALIASTAGRLCARLFRRADGTILTKDCPVGLRALRMRVSKRAAAVFAAIASISAMAFGQQSSANKDGKTACTPQTRITRTSGSHGQATTSVSGTVLDLNRAIIPGAKVLIKNVGTNEAWNTSTDAEGRFQYDSLAPGNYWLKIEATGFKSHVVTNIILESNQLLDVDMILELNGETVTVGIIGDPSAIDTSSSSNTFILSGDLLRKLPIPK